MNDPNGMVYVDGVYHLFYQYNPRGNDWGNMSWGHATSPDMIRWTEQSVALTEDELGAVFSGSAVIDKNNTAGFGANAMVALYTSAGSAQQQSVAYSTDGGKTFSRYNANPVIKNNDDNLRPRVASADGVYVNATPEKFEQHIRQAIDIIKNKQPEHRLIFLKSWNEWGEGNYVEPDQQFGHGFLDAIRKAQQ